MPIPVTDNTRDIYTQGPPADGARRSISVGDSVNVKVLELLGNGNYLISFKGVKVTAQSSAPLTKGERLTAVIQQSDNGKIILRVQDAEQPALRQNQDITAFLYSQGLNTDSTTGKIVQQMIQSGIPLNKALIRKAKSAAAEAAEGASSYIFGDEDTAGEIAALLLEKGLQPSKETIKSVMWAIKGKKKPEKQGSRRQEQGAPLLDEIYENPPANKDGLLAVVNQLKSKETTGKHWIFLPYTYETDGKEANGLIRILIDLNTKRTEKALIDCNTDSKRYCFILKFEGAAVKAKYCTTPELSARESRTGEERLRAILEEGVETESVSASYSDAAFFEGLCAQKDFTLPLRDFTV